MILGQCQCSFWNLNTCQKIVRSITRYRVVTGIRISSSSVALIKGKRLLLMNLINLTPWRDEATNKGVGLCFTEHNNHVSLLILPKFFILTDGSFKLLTSHQWRDVSRPKTQASIQIDMNTKTYGNGNEKDNSTRIVFTHINFLIYVDGGKSHQVRMSIKINFNMLRYFVHTVDTTMMSIWWAQ